MVIARCALAGVAGDPGLLERGISPGFPSLPLWFEANAGQVDSQVQFLARGHGHNILLTPTEAVIVLRKPVPAGEARRGARDVKRMKTGISPVRFQLVAADPDARMSGAEALPGRANYLLGANPAEWRRHVSTFRQVKVQQVYAGVDVLYYANGQRLEYDFHLAPGVDPGAIRLRIEGADRVELDSAGNLIVESCGERLLQHRPVAYQDDGAVRRSVDVAYRLTGERTFGFVVGEADSALPLIIDPVLSYASYLGGSKQETAWDLALDSSGNVYVTGESLSLDLPATTGAFQTNYGGGTTVGGDIFVAKLDASGSNLVYLTYLGGKGNDAALSIAIDATGNAYLTGFTDSTNFPLASPVIGSIGGKGEKYFDLFPSDAFVTKLNANGSALVYSTYLGGSTNDQGIAIAVDSSGSAFVAGFTTSTNFPTVNALQTTNAGLDDAFVTKVAPDGSAFVYSTYLGGTNTDQAQGIAVDAVGRAFVTGFTQSTNFPLALAIQPWLAGGQDVFVSALSPDGQSLSLSTYLGSSGNEVAYRIALDASGHPHVTGAKDGFSYPVTTGALNPGGVFRTDDNGANWTSASQGLLHVSIGALAVDPVFPARVYAGTAHGVARSSNGGTTWESKVIAPPDSEGLAPAIAVGLVSGLAVDPVTPATVYAGTVSEGVFKSLDAGITWSLASTGLVNLTVNALAVDPLSPVTVYAGTAAGVYRSTNAATNWRSFSSGIGSQDIRALVLDPVSPDTLYAATPNGVYRSLNRGTNWYLFRNGLTNYSVLSLAINPVAPSTLYAGTVTGLFKTTDRATNWSGLHVATGASNVNALAVDPQSPSTLYAATSAGLYKSADAGVGWTLCSGLLATELAINPQTPARVFAGTYSTNSLALKDVFLTKLSPNNLDAYDLAYSAVFGGTSDDEGWDVALDSAGNAYVVGATTSTNFPVTQPLPFQKFNRGGWDAFVTAIGGNGSALLYSTYLGGRSNDLAFGVEVDLNGNAYVVGQTLSTNLLAHNAVQPLAGGLGDAFVAKLIVIPPPSLSIASANPNVIVSWPAQAFGYLLQSKTNLSTNVWLNVTNTPVLSDGAYKVTLGATNQTRYFRLLSP
jgi:hypothetical protein